MDRSKIIVKTSIYAIITNILLVIFKSVVGILVNSIAIVLDAVNNLSDAVSSIITIIGAKLAGKAPDKEHPYGHGRIEYIAAVAIALIILLAGFVSMKESVQKIIFPVKADYSAASIVIVTVAIFVKYFLARYVKGTGKKINSQSLIASGTDAYFDAIIALSTLVAAIISLVWNLSLEGYIGIVISALIIKSGLGILKETLNTIIGLRADGELSKRIKEALLSYDEVHGAYDLMLHSYGPSNIIGGVNIEVDENMKASEIHILSKRIQKKIYADFGIILTIGIYASNTADENAMKVRNEAERIIEKYPEVIGFHGFYLDNESKDVSFDIVVDFSANNPKDTKSKIKTELKEKYPEYNYSVVIDNDFSD